MNWLSPRQAQRPFVGVQGGAPSAGRQPYPRQRQQCRSAALHKVHTSSTERLLAGATGHNQLLHRPPTPAAGALWPYMVPLLLVYFAEYAMQSGTWTAIGEQH